MRRFTKNDPFYGFVYGMILLKTLINKSDLQNISEQFFQITGLGAASDISWVSFLGGMKPWIPVYLLLIASNFDDT